MNGRHWKGYIKMSKKEREKWTEQWYKRIAHDIAKKEEREANQTAKLMIGERQLRSTCKK